MSISRKALDAIAPSEMLSWSVALTGKRTWAIINLVSNYRRMYALLVRTMDLIGAVTANTYFLLITAVFALRLVGHAEIGRWLGIASFLAIIPLTYLLACAFNTHRPFMYFLWLGLMILFLTVELVIDSILELEFRSAKWATVSYVVFFFAATGGMIGIAGQAGKWWTAATVLTFLVMAAMAFVQRAKTGL